MRCLFLNIAIDTPLDIFFDYKWQSENDDEPNPSVGDLAVVPFGKREVCGVILEVKTQTDVAENKIRNIIAIRHQLLPLSQHWLDLCRFAAHYYQRPLGEVALPCLPKNLRSGKAVSLDRALKKIAKIEKAGLTETAPYPTLNAEQQQALDAIVTKEGFAPILLHGITGSGKTEVYLQATAHILARTPTAQVLILVPEINLTPQFTKNLQDRFPNTPIALLHSELAEGERLRHWLSAHTGQARIVLGTRLSILASMPNLQFIVIDEEHDSSYKQQEGLRYSARDLAIWRAQQLDIPVVLGSATPSLESWQHAKTHRYSKLTLSSRAVAHAVLPTVRLIDSGKNQLTDGLSAAMLAAIQLRLDAGEQSLLFLNRRGYAPALSCTACGWVSHCTRCTAYMVLHTADRRLRCHHCSLEIHIPRHCPSCGNVDMQPIGQGTQRIEENIQIHFPDAKILRIDADSTRRKGSAKAAFNAVHEGEVDILIGTQMVAKGHDFRNLTLVGVLNPDHSLFSHDYRAAERLFAQLMQVSGRAGRTAQKTDGAGSEVLIQTRFPHHPLYTALTHYDYPLFADMMLNEREQAMLPPFSYQAIIRAEAKELDDALHFLNDISRRLQADSEIITNDAIPMARTRVANVNRAQLLLESPSRATLQATLRAWLPIFRAERTRVKWTLEVDPADI